MKTLNTLQVRNIKINFTQLKVSDYYKGTVYKEIDCPGLLILKGRVCEIYTCGRLNSKIVCDNVWEELEIHYKR